jgi:hypothetical protein
VIIYPTFAYGGLCRSLNPSSPLKEGSAEFMSNYP